MSRAELRAPILDQGIRHTNFFNGRLLFAEDLFNEAEANRAQHRQLGRAAGDGLVHGLDVWTQAAGLAGTTPVLRVTAGLAINRRGQAVELPRDIDLALVREEEEAVSDAGLFGGCRTPAGVQVSIGAGAYLLVLSPASGFSRERAPMSGLTAAGAISGCGSRYAIEGVQFRLETLHTSGTTGPAGAAGADLDALVTTATPAADSLFRNRLAHMCLGTAALAGLSANPAPVLGSGAAVGLLEQLRQSRVLTDCDVPLAIVRWISSVQYVDTWAVRRQTARPEWASALTYISDARGAVARSALFQFQRHLRDLLGTSGAPGVMARNFFRYLPSSGVVPLRNEAHPAGFSPVNFFNGLAFGPARPIAAAQVRPLLQESIAHDAIDLSTNPRIQLYVIAENEAAQGESTPPQRVLLFASAVTPYLSEQPRFPELCQSLRDTVTAFVSLLGQNVFFPHETDPRAAAARNDIVRAIVDVIDVARQRSTLACAGWGLPYHDALAALRDLYHAERRLAHTLRTNWPGIPNTAVVAGLGDELLAVLEGSAASLDSTLTAGDLPAAINAQSRIPQILGGWGAEAVTGVVTVQYIRSTRGRTLVERSGNQFNYIFRITNQTNRSLRFLLSASFMPPKAAWSSSIAILDMAGNPIQSVQLALNASVEVQASIVPPAEAAAPDVAQLLFLADAPGRVSDDEPLDLFVGTTEVPDVPTVELRPTSRTGPAPNNAREEREMVQNYDIRFQTPVSPLARQFTARLRLTIANAAELNLFDVVMTTPAGTLESTPAIPNADLTSAAFQLSHAQPAQLSVAVTPHVGSLNRTLTWNLELASTTTGVTPDSATVNVVVLRPN